jgi:hypothetical protein
MGTVKTVAVFDIFSNPPVFVIQFGAGARAASRYGFGSGSGSTKKMRLLAAPAPATQHCFYINTIFEIIFKKTYAYTVIE